ncbi:hypothetical protein AB833_14480 [Chromatiales bacterium (ex Bugula neritina AB1)]|nr:hypothetical protein AB833_14480 [Chromatiales bacterium (ex Bugula neritina AB1)]
MRYLIGEIGISLLAAGLIGLIVGWLMSRYFKTRSIDRSRRELEECIRVRDDEIDLLQSDLQEAEHSLAEAANSTPQHKEEAVVESLPDNQSAEPLKKDVVNKIVAQETATPVKETLEETDPAQARASDSSSDKTALDSVTEKYQKVLDQKNRQVEQLHEKIRELMSSVGPRSAPLRSARNDDQQRILKKTVEEESFAKLQALAALGETERKLTHLEGMDRPQDNELTALRRYSMQQEALTRNLQKRLDIQQSQTSTIHQSYQRKIHAAAQVDLKRRSELTVQSQQVVPLERRAEQQASIIHSLNKRLEIERENSLAMKQAFERKLAQSAAGAVAQSDTGPDKQLKQQLEDANFAKAQALAAVGELERRLEVHDSSGTTDTEVLPLHHKAEQQESIIQGLRKDLEILQSQNSTQRQEYERKLRGREADLAGLRAEKSGRNAEVSEAELDSYKRRLLEAERSSQSRIKDFNAILEARNKEYDQLGIRLEELRETISGKDAQLAEQKIELEARVREKADGAVEFNRLRESYGELEVLLGEKDAAIKVLQNRTMELERANGDVKDIEKQLADFTSSTEKSARKFEGIILEQRRKIESYEQQIARLQSELNTHQSESTQQILSLKTTADDQRAANSRQMHELVRFRTQATGKDSQISSLSKELRDASQTLARHRAEIRKLAVVNSENEKLQLLVAGKNRESGQLQRQLLQAKAISNDALQQHESILAMKEDELNALNTELARVRTSLESSQIALKKAKQETELRNIQLQRNSQRQQIESKQQLSRIAEIEPLKQRLSEKEAENSRISGEHELALKRASDELQDVRAKLELKLNHRQQELSSVQTRLEHAEGQLTKLKGELATGTATSEQAIAELEEKLAGLADKRRLELADRDKQIEANQQEIEELRVTRIALTKKEDELETLLAGKSQNAEQLQTQLAQAQSAAEEALQQHEVVLSNRDKQLTDLNTELASLRSSLESGRVALQKARQEVEERNIQLQRNERKQKIERTQLLARIAEIEPLRLKLAEKEVEVSRVSGEVELAEKRYTDELQELRSKFGVELGAKQEELVSAQSVIDQNETRIEKLKSELAAAAASSDKVVQSLEKKLAGVEEARQRELADRDKKIETQRQELEELESIRTALSENENELRAREKQLKTLEDEKNNLAKQSAERQRNIVALNRDIDSATSELSQVQQKLTEQANMAATLKSDISRLKAESSAELTKTLADFKNQTAQRVAENNAVLDRKQNELDAIQAQLKSVQQERLAENQKNKVLIDRLQNEVSEKERQAQNSLVKLDEVKTNLRTSQADMGALQQKLAENDNRYNEYKKSTESDSKVQAVEIESLTARLTEMEGLSQQLSTQERERAELQKTLGEQKQRHIQEIEKLRSRLRSMDDLQKKLSASEAQCRKLEATIDGESKARTIEVSALKTQISQLESLQQKLTASEFLVRGLEQSHKEASNQHAREVAELRRQLKQADENQKQLADKEEAVKSLALELHEVKQRLATETNGQQAATKALESSKDQLTKLSNESATLKARLNELTPLQAKLDSAESRLKTLQNQQQDANKQHEVTQRHHQEQLAKIKSESAATTERMEKQLNSLRKESSSAQAAMQSKLEESRLRIADLEPLEKALSARETELEKLRSEFVTAKSEQQIEIRRLEKDLGKAKSIEGDVAAKDSQLRQTVEQLEHFKAENKLTLSEIARLKSEVAEKDSEMADLAAKARDAATLEEKLAEANRTLKRGELEHRSLEEKVEAIDARMSREREESAREKASLQAQINAARADAKEHSLLSAQLEQYKASASDAVGEINEYKRRLAGSAETERQLSELRKLFEVKSREHREALSRQAAEIQALQTDASAGKSRLSGEIAEPGTAFSSTPAQSADAQPVKAPAVTADGKKTQRKDGQDDLKLIFGIGPKIEQMLNDDGVRYFSEIARWTDADVRRYSEKLESFPDRIERDEWILSARQIVEGTYNWKERKKARDASAKAAKSSVLAKNYTGTGRVTVTADGRKTTRKDGMDDLKLIFGIGTKIEKMLNRKGVRRFEDIAAWDEADVERFSKMLEGFPDRIQRDEWILSAKQIIAGTYNWIERKKARTWK